MSDLKKYISERKKKDNINWDRFWEVNEEYTCLLKNKGVIISKIDGAEGDDLLFLWSRYFKSIGEDCIILTSDSDSYQSVSINENDSVCVIYNNNTLQKKIVAPIGFKEWLDVKKPKTLMDFSINTSRDILQNLTQEIKVLEVDSKKYITEKILLGDDSDDIPSLWIWQKANGKSDRITPSKSKLIMEELNKIEDFQVIDLLYRDDYHKIIYNKLKEITKMDIDFDKVVYNIIRNVNLILLHERIIPLDIQDKFREELSTKRTGNFTKTSLLEGSRFFKENETTEVNYYREWI